MIIVQMDDAEATIAMVDSNLQWEHIRPSGKAILCSDELLAKQVGEGWNQSEGLDMDKISERKPGRQILSSGSYRAVRTKGGS